MRSAVFVARMFTIIGADGKQYGPVGVSQIQAWIHGGRASLDTKAKAVGSEEWRRLGDFAEFNNTVAEPPAMPAVPPLPSAPVLAAAPVRPAVDTSDLASRGTRTGAAFVNAFIYFMSTIPGSVAMSRKLIELNPELAKGGFPRFDQLDLAPVIGSVVWVWAGILGAIVLQAIVIALRGQNLGKMMFGARVVRVSDGQPAGFLQGALLRFLLPVAIVIFLNLTTLVLGFVFLAVDYCFMFREDQRCLHDLMAGTKVVRA